MAITWTNTSNTDLVLPHGTVVPGGLTVLERMEGAFEACTKNPLIAFLIDTGVLKHDNKAKAPASTAVNLFNGGPVAGSANTATTSSAVAPLPASDPGPGSNPPIAAPTVVKTADGTHEVRVGDDVIASGLTKKEADALASDPSKAPA